MSEVDNWPVGQLCRARDRAYLMAAGVGLLVVAPSLAAVAVVAVIGSALPVVLLGAGAAVLVMVVATAVAVRAVDRAAPLGRGQVVVPPFGSIGGRRPAGRSPAEPTIRPEVGRFNLPSPVRSRASQEERA
ncbi:MAG: hypothetical protein OEW29_18930 [Acidimicrobiia bacterium]|nr:hypothetical protein [Acidimicrobiia bacterium]